MNKKILIHAWFLEKKSGNYYLPYTHWIYLKEIVKYYDEVILLSPCRYLGTTEETTALDISLLSNKMVVYELPGHSGGYISSLKYFFHYVKAYSSIKDITTYYSRYPTPFGWLQKIYGKDSQRIIHYVGDPVDAAKNNPNFNLIKKKLLISGFYLENYLYTWACKGAGVYTNGDHLAKKLDRKGISAIPLTSSTLLKSDFSYSKKKVTSDSARFIYLGNLRTAKGVETIIKAFGLYNKEFPNSSLTIIGSGDFEKKLKEIGKLAGIQNLFFLGRIDDRDIINRELRKADIFLFGSLSEGSPRVVLEAMANGLAVISTPVGSLPSDFENKKDIIFVGFNNYEEFFLNMCLLASNNDFYNKLRESSYYKVKNKTLEKFIERIFYEKQS